MGDRRGKSVLETYHIMTRGVNKQNIFWDDDDRRIFLQYLVETKKKYDFKLYAYCLMSNHVHLVIKEEKHKKSKVMQSLNCKYAKYMNKKYEREGHLFQNRYLSKPINTLEYLFKVQRYIHQNPEKSKICSTEKYMWSSYKDYIKGSGITDTEYILKLFSTQYEEAVNKFIQYNHENIFEDDEFEYEFKNRLEDYELINIIKQKYNINSIYELQKYNNSILKNIIKEIKTIKGTSNIQIARVLGIERKKIERLK